MKNMFVVVLLLVVLGGGYYFMQNQPQTADDEMMLDSMDSKMMVEKSEGGEATTPAEATAASMTVEADGTKVFELEASEMKFSATEIRVKKGDKVKIVLKNVGEYKHDWVLDEFEAETDVIEGGKTDEVIFTADKTGTFEYYCSVMEHRQKGMVGKFIVEE